MAVVLPMPSARIAIARRAKPWERRSERKAGVIDDAIGKLLRIADEKRFVVLCDFLIWPSHSETVCIVSKFA